MSRTALTAHDRETYRRRLRELTARLSGGVVELESEALRPPPGEVGNGGDAPAHEADHAVRASEEAVALTLLASEEQLLNEATAALRRLAAGTFGACERCGSAIAKTRLDVLPYTRTCARCAHGTDDPSSA